MDIPNLTRVQNRNFHLFIDSYSNHCLHLSSLSDVFVDILGFLTIFQYKKSAQVVNFDKISYVTIIFFSSPGPFSAIALRFRFSQCQKEKESAESDPSLYGNTLHYGYRGHLLYARHSMECFTWDISDSLCKEPEPVREMLRLPFYRGEKLHVSRVLKVTWLQSDKIRILTLLAPAHNSHSILPLLLETKRQRPIIS